MLPSVLLSFHPNVDVVSYVSKHIYRTKQEEADDGCLPIPSPTSRNGFLLSCIYHCGYDIHYSFMLDFQILDYDRFLIGTEYISEHLVNETTNSCN